LRVLLIFSAFVFVVASGGATAHRSGCHRWHSCPSDRGTYVCGDLGYSNYCPKKPISTYPTTLLGANSDTIYAIQNALTELGYDPGPIDGKMGKKTRAAITQFQVNSGLSPDGRASSSLLLKLQK